MSRKNQHQDDKPLRGVHKTIEGKTGGGACLVRCKAPRAKGARGRLRRNSCSYRWQGFERALRDDHHLYDFPRYRKLCKLDSLILDTTKGQRKRAAPTEGSWDVSKDGDNFQTSCNTPYWHEAHHLIPNAELKAAIQSITKGPQQAEYAKLYRRGLLAEKYNLNHKRNMMILPLDNTVSEALKLPRHREDASVFSHRAYSNKVRQRLKTAFPEVTAQEKQHEEKPEYRRTKNKLLDVSDEMREWVIGVGGGKSLDGAVAAPKKQKPERPE